MFSQSVVTSQLLVADGVGGGVRQDLQGDERRQRLDEQSAGGLVLPRQEGAHPLQGLLRRLVVQLRQLLRQGEEDGAGGAGDAAVDAAADAATILLTWLTMLALVLSLLFEK